MDDKQHELLADVIREDVMSNCCGGKVFAPTDEWAYCMECDDYCDVVKNEE